MLPSYYPSYSFSYRDSFTQEERQYLLKIPEVFSHEKGWELSCSSLKLYFSLVMLRLSAFGDKRSIHIASEKLDVTPRTIERAWKRLLEKKFVKRRKGKLVYPRHNWKKK